MDTIYMIGAHSLLLAQRIQRQYLISAQVLAHIYLVIVKIASWIHAVSVFMSGISWLYTVSFTSPQRKSSSVWDQVSREANLWDRFNQSRIRETLIKKISHIRKPCVDAPSCWKINHGWNCLLKFLWTVTGELDSWKHILLFLEL